jgi:GTPase Era involved in 16S rRNA processing
MEQKSAFVAVVGRPSSKIDSDELPVREKVSIVSPVPQTTRTRYAVS